MNQHNEVPRELLAWMAERKGRLVEIDRVGGPWTFSVTVRDEAGDSVNTLGPSLYVAACRSGHRFVPSLPSFAELEADSPLPSLPLPFANHRREIEREVIVALVEDVLAAGFSIEVNDGEDDVLPPSRDAAAIFAAMSSTDEERLFLYEGSKRRHTKSFGWVRLVYGNDGDVISDYTTNIPESVFDRAAEIADRFSGRPARPLGWRREAVVEARQAADDAEFQIATVNEDLPAGPSVTFDL